MIYFDNNSTTRAFDCVADAMRPFLTSSYANLSSPFARVSGISEAVQKAKTQIQKTLKIESTDQLIFTSGATESNNLAILGAAKSNPRRKHLITSSIEHPSVLETIEALRSVGYTVSILPCGSNGVICFEDLAALLTQETLLVSAMLANNETGVIQPISSLAAIVKAFDSSILVHTDATQAVGKIPVDLDDELCDVDLLSLSAHKFHGPKGVGALFVRDLEVLSPIVHGGGQQRGLRSGTENPSGVIGMSTALSALESLTGSTVEMQRLVSSLESGIKSANASAFVLGAGAYRLPNTLNVCLPGIDADQLVDQMAMRQIAISAGSACSYGALRPSHVAIALGLNYDQAKCCIRISLSTQSTQEEARQFLANLNDVLSNTSLHFHTPTAALA